MTMMAKLSLVALTVVACSGTAMAADLYTPPPAAPAAVAPATTDWSGPYVGISTGYGWASANSSTGASNSVDGWKIGGQVGYNANLTDTVVAGIEGDLNWNDQQGTFAGVAPGTYRMNWDGSIRGRLGVDVDGILPYAEAGVAFTNATLTDGVTNPSDTYTGWTAGAGVEFKVADPVSLNVEYRYSDYGNRTFDGDSVHLNDNTVKLGLNYHF